MISVKACHPWSYDSHMTAPPLSLLCTANAHEVQAVDGNTPASIFYSLIAQLVLVEEAVLKRKC